MHSNALSHALHRMPKTWFQTMQLSISLFHPSLNYTYILIHIYVSHSVSLTFNICMDVWAFNSTKLMVLYQHFTYMDIVLCRSYGITTLISYIELFSMFFKIVLNLKYALIICFIRDRSWFIYLFYTLISYIDIVLHRSYGMTAHICYVNIYSLVFNLF